MSEDLTPHEQMRRMAVECDAAIQAWRKTHCDAAIQAWREAHKDDPCERCGSRVEVDIFPSGSLGKLAILCAVCRYAAYRETEAYWRGFKVGAQHFKRLSWWQRLLPGSEVL